MSVRMGRPAAATGGAALNVRLAVLAAFVVSLLIWLVPGATVLLLPLHPYLTFVHEGWHALVAVLTGGHVSAVHIFGVDGGGVTVLAGGAALLVASAGYVGSAVSGAVFLALLPRPALLRLAMAAQYAWLLAVGLWWDHDLNAWLYLLVFGAALYLLATRLPERVFAVVSAVLALQLALAVLGDLRTLLFLSAFSPAHSDALLAAQMTHLPSLFWAALWAAIDGALLLGAFRAALRYPLPADAPAPGRPTGAGTPGIPALRGRW